MLPAPFPSPGVRAAAAVLLLVHGLAAQAPATTVRIGGVVTDLAGRGIPRAHVDLVRTADQTTVATTIADGSGAFSWPRAPQGEHRVRARADGHVAMTVAPTWNNARTAGACSLRLPDARALRGRITDDHGQRLRASLKVYDRTLATDQDEPETTSDAMGAYTLTGVPLGPLRLVAHAPDHGVQIVDLPLGGDATQDVVLKRDAGVTLVLQLAGAPAEQLAGGWCYFYAYDATHLVSLPDDVRRGRADGAGRWVVHGLPSTLRYRSFGAFVPGFQPLVAEAEARPPFAEPRLERTLTVSRSTDVDLRGQLRDERGQPLANQQLSLETAEGPLRLTTDGEGRWRATARETFGGHWPMRLDDDQWVLDPRPEDRVTLPYRATFRIRRSDRDLLLTARPATTLQGKVVSGGGAPVTGATVELIPAAGRADLDVVASTLTDADGHFGFAREHDDALDLLRVRVRLHDDAAAADVAPAGERPGDDRILRLPTLRLQPAAWWSGTLNEAGAGGRPLGGAIVVLQRHDDAWRDVATEVCARDGSFRFEARRAGQWRVVARLDEREAASEPTTADGSAQTFPLQMPR